MSYDKIVKNCQVFNSFLKRFVQCDVAIKDGYFARVDKNIEDDDALIIDGQNHYMIPGLVDIHMHVESSMSIPTRFSDAVLQHGTTTVVADPHEIANVFGEEGILFFLSLQTPLDIFFGIPSSVPATNPNLETTGGIIGVEEVKRLLHQERIVCLGEVMNFKDVCYEKDSLSYQIIETCKEGRFQMPLEGHCPKITQKPLADFLFRGISADHTQQTPESVYEKIANGMFLEIQRKSMSKEVLSALMDNNFYEYFCFVTDDVMPDKLRYGHLNELVKLAIEMGMPKEMAIYCATFTPARRMHLENRGAIAPGRIADFILLNDADTFDIDHVYKKGESVQNLKAEPAQIPERFLHSIHCRKAIADDFEISLNGTQALCNIMEIEPHSTFTRHQQQWLPVVDQKLQYETEGLSLITVFERYGKSGNIAHGLVKNTLTQKGAIATSWAHDHHNVMVIGNDRRSMLAAQHKLLDIDGGLVVVKEGKVLATCALEIGGIVSARKIEDLGSDVEKIRSAMQELGYVHDNELMSVSTLSLLVSPALKISDHGMVDTRTQKIVPLVEKIK